MEPRFRCQTVVAKRPDSIWGGRPEVKCLLCNEWVLEDELQVLRVPKMPRIKVCPDCEWTMSIAVAREAARVPHRY
jgi:hypothetical protein